MARDRVGPSHEHTPQSVIDAPKPVPVWVPWGIVPTRSVRRLRVLERRAARAAAGRGKR